MNELLAWIRSHEALVAWVGVLSIAFFVGNLLLAPLLVARIPTDYFASEEPPPGSWAGRHPAARLALRIVRNVAGALLILMGIAMLVLPGQGLLTILVGVLLLDYPGKRALELRALRHRRIRRPIDWMRRRAGRPPLVVHGVEPEDG